MTILFVCTGNTCRSPMAAGLFNAAARKAGLPVSALSCGLAAIPGDPVTPEAARAALAWGADIAGHTAAPVSETLAKGASRIYGMTQGHVTALRTRFPGCAARIDMLDGADIADPFGGGPEVYARAAKQIAGAVERLLSLLCERESGKTL